jgi:hypothetical protein
VSYARHVLPSNGLSLFFLLSLASELRKEIADTMLSNLETDKKMFRSLATEVCLAIPSTPDPLPPRLLYPLVLVSDCSQVRGRLFAQRDLDLGISDVACSVLWVVSLSLPYVFWGAYMGLQTLDLIARSLPEKPSLKVIVGAIGKVYLYRS